jgi:predicted alpha-1,6-mannanase (GH76 family)
VADHILPAGEKVWWRFSYNEGTMIGAALELHRATGDAAYLETARRIGAFLAKQETVTSSAGDVLSDGPNCSGDCDQFKGIAQRYLAALAAADPAGGWGALVHANAEAIWDLARDPGRDLFGVDWAGPAGSAGSVNLASQSSAAMALSVEAEAAGPYPG